MKIAIIYDVVYPYRMGGGEKRNWELARRLVARGHEVTLVSLKMWDGPDEIMQEGVRLSGVCPWESRFFEHGRRSMAEPRRFAAGVKAYLKGRTFDVIDCASFPYLPCFEAAKASRSGAGKLVITWYEVRGVRRWIDHRGLLGFAAGCLERRTAGLAACHVAISEFTADRAKRLLNIRDVKVVPCGVNSASIPEGSREDQLLYVGRLAPYKRVDLLIRAFGRIAGDFPALRLKIVGSGEDGSGLVKLAEELGLKSRVEFVERLDENALRKEYAGSKVFVLPSEQEGFGIVVVEAMAAGTPVVVMDAPNSAAVELVTHGRNGMLVTDEKGMAETIMLLLTDGALSRNLAEEGRKTARRFDWDGAIVPQLESLYRTLK